MVRVNEVTAVVAAAGGGAAAEAAVTGRRIFRLVQQRTITSVAIHTERLTARLTRCSRRISTTGSKLH